MKPQTLELWQEKIKSVLNANKFDLMNYRQLTEELPDICADDAKLARRMGGNPLRDAFWSMHKANPVLDPSPGLEVLGDIFHEAMETPGYKDLRRVAQGDLVASGVAAQTFATTLASIVPPNLQNQMAATDAHSSKLFDLLEEINGLDELMEDMGEAGELLEQIKRQRADKVKEARRTESSLQKAQKAAQSAFAKNKAQMVNKINIEAKKTSTKVEATMEMIKGFSEAAGGEPGKVGVEAARAAMNLLARNRNLRKLAEFLGWAKRTTQASLRKSLRGRTEMTGYKNGQLDLSRLAASEFTAMVSHSPVMKLGFLCRVADGALRHRHYSGEEQLGKGGMVIVRDESGSMDGAPHSLAVAVEWALLNIAREQNRPFFSIPFSSSHHVWEAKGATVESLTAHLEHFYGYGTSPYPALTTALNLIDEGAGEADILMITDGYFGYPSQTFKDALQKAKERRPFKIIVVSVGVISELEWADKIINVSNLVDDKEMLSEAFDLIV